MIINQFLSYIFFKIGYLIITPKTHSFGGFYNSIFWGYKLKKKNNLKLIIAVPLINLDERNIFSIYNLDFIYLLLKKMGSLQKTISLLLTIFLNLQIIILLLLRKVRIWKIFPKIINYFICEYIGFRDHQNKDDFFLKKINSSYDEIVLEDLNLSNLYNQNLKKTIAFCIKDNNYSKIKEISSFMSSDINLCNKSLNYLINENFKIFRVGERSMNKYKFLNKNYEDLCFKNNYKYLLNYTYANCDFYFGSSASHGIIPEIFNKKKFLINHTEHLELSYSRSLDNFILFKNIFCNKNKKFLSLNEIFKQKLFDNTAIKESINENLISLTDNSEEEIFESLVEFYETNYKSKKKNNSLIEKYLVLRREVLIKYGYSTSNFYQQFKCNIPEFYLKKYLD